MNALAPLLEFLSIPSVSTDPARKEDVLRAALWLRERLKALGFRTELVETPLHPILYAERLVDEKSHGPGLRPLRRPAPGPPGALGDATLLPGGEGGPGLRPGGLRRQGPALRPPPGGGGAPVNLKFLVEGEEEIGSPHLAPFVRANREKLRADVVVVSDGAMFAPQTPTLTYGLRGLCYLEVRLRGARRDLHSGAFGGVAPNPIQALGWLLARLKDEKTGRS